MKPWRQIVQLLGREVPVLPAADGTVRAQNDGKPASAKSVQSYIAKVFGDRLPDVQAAMETVAATLPAEELNRVGFRLYERFRTDMPDSAQGWGAKGELRIDRIRSAVD